MSAVFYEIEKEEKQVKVVMLTRSAGKSGTIMPGQIIDVSEAEAKLLINGRYAKAVDEEKTEGKKPAGKKPAEKKPAEKKTPEVKPEEGNTKEENADDVKTE